MSESDVNPTNSRSRKPQLGWSISFGGASFSTYLRISVHSLAAKTRKPKPLNSLVSAPRLLLTSLRFPNASDEPTFWRYVSIERVTSVTRATASCALVGFCYKMLTLVIIVVVTRKSACNCHSNCFHDDHCCYSCSYGCSYDDYDYDCDYH